MIVKRIINGTPGMLPKAYRWVGEMEEISAFVGDGLSGSLAGQGNTATEGAGEALIHLGLARLYERIAAALSDSEKAGDDLREVKVLRDFVKEAKNLETKK